MASTEGRSTRKRAKVAVYDEEESDEAHFDEDRVGGTPTGGSAEGDESFDQNLIGKLKKQGQAKLMIKPIAFRKASIGGKWTAEEDEELRNIVVANGAKNWKKVASLLGDMRTDIQCLHRWNKVLKPGLHKGTWSEEEDIIVRDMVSKYGVGHIKWSLIAEKLPGRIGKQCRERWFNHLDPAIKKGEWSADEDKILYEAQRTFGNRWCEISKVLPGRTENAVKNRWNSSGMRKWFKDNHLIPGSGVPAFDLHSSSGMDKALTAFCDALEKSGVKSMTYDKAAALLGMGDLLVPGGGIINSDCCVE